MLYHGIFAPHAKWHSRAIGFENLGGPSRETATEPGARGVVELGIEVDNLLDIATNKLSAFYDRSEPKDFVDASMINREALPFRELVEKARQKHVGLDSYWLAQACARVREVRLLPRLIKPVSLEELPVSFEDQAGIEFMLHCAN